MRRFLPVEGKRSKAAREALSALWGLGYEEG
jgi:hypothetical protein